MAWLVQRDARPRESRCSCLRVTGQCWARVLQYPCPLNMPAGGRRLQLGEGDAEVGLLAGAVLEQEIGAVVLAAAIPRVGQGPEESPGLDPEAADGRINGGALGGGGSLHHKVGVPVARVEKLLEFVVVVLQLVKETLPDRLAVGKLDSVELERAGFLADGSADPGSTAACALLGLGLGNGR